MPSDSHKRDRAPGVIEVGYLHPGEERAAVELFAAVAAERRWIGTEPPVDIDGRTAGLVGSLAVGQQTMIVARARGRIVGTLSLYRAADHVPETIWLGMLVAADCRGAGVGSALVAFAIDHARKAGYRAIGLEVFPHNEAARRLYRSFGFVERESLVAHLLRADGTRWDIIRCQLSLVADESGS